MDRLGATHNAKVKPGVAYVVGYPANRLAEGYNSNPPKGWAKEAKVTHG